MKLTSKTISILKNFSTINQNLMVKTGNALSTMSAMKNIVAQAEVTEKFPQDFAIYDLNEFLSRVGEESDWEYDGYVEGHEYGNVYPEKGQHICQFQSHEKGTFFESIIETALPFDQNLLKFATEEAPDGEDLVYGVEYDGVDVDNYGGDTNGKGYYAHFWKQEY